MNQSFSIGMHVKFIDEPLSGVIVNIQDGKIWVEIEKDFIIPVLPSMLMAAFPMPINSTIQKMDKEEHPKNYTSKKPKEEDENLWLTKKKIKKKTDKHFFVNPIHIPELASNPKPQKTKEKIPQIDLHLESLSPQKINPTQALSLQLNALQNFVNHWKTKKIKEIIVIHGVGKGVLRNEVKNWLQQNHNCEIEDASISTYGVGACKVRFFYN
jgi:DNA-nicking Smr family endonuclease